MVKVDPQNLLKSFSSTGPWLERKGAVGAALLGFVVVAILVQIGFFVPPSSAESFLTRHVCPLAYLAIPLVFVVGWLGITQLYLRTGTDLKVGLAYDGHAVKLEDWSRTRRTLRNLLKAGSLKNRVSLRFIPKSATQDNAKASKFMKRYRFSLLLTVRQSPMINPPNPLLADSPPLGLEIVTRSKQKQFMRATLSHTLAIAARRKSGPTLMDILNTRAQTLHDFVLLFVAAECFLRGKIDDASSILRHLDQCLSNLIQEHEQPRAQIRALDAECRIRRARFPIAEFPNYDELQEIRQVAETALPYVKSDPTVGLTLARIRFLCGDAEGADRLMAEMKDQPMDDRVRAVVLLNIGFLAFYQARWQHAYDAFTSMLGLPTYSGLPWDDIIDFIDHVAAFPQDGICVLQVLYRRIAQKPVPPELKQKAQDWVSQDKTRQGFQRLLARNYSARRKAASTAHGPPPKRPPT